VNDKGAVVKGIVKEVEAKAAIITLAPDVDAVLKASELSREKVEDARNLLKVGDEVEAKIIAVDRKNRGISLSVKSKDVEEEKSALKDHSTKQTEQVAAPATLGDLIKAQMQNKE
jgi:small subunit ribosomal protein S1